MSSSNSTPHNGQAQQTHFNQQGNQQPPNNNQPSQFTTQVIGQSELPPGITKYQVAQSLADAGITLQTIKGILETPILIKMKGKIRSEYIPMTRVETEYKEEVQYSNVPRIVKTHDFQQKSKDNTPISENSPQYQQEANGITMQLAGQNGNKTPRQIQQETVNYQRIPISENPNLMSNQQRNAIYQQNTPKYDPHACIITPTVQIKGCSSVQNYYQNIPQKSVFSQAIQYAQQPIQSVKVASPIQYSSPIAYTQQVQRMQPVAYNLQVNYQQQPFSYQPATQIPQGYVMYDTIKYHQNY